MLSTWDRNAVGAWGGIARAAKGFVDFIRVYDGRPG